MHAPSHRAKYWRIFVATTFTALAPLTGLGGVAVAQEEAPKQTLFTNVQIFDGVNEERMAGNVLVEGNMIKLVSAAAISAPGATVIDGGGRTLMPGLIEGHGHLQMNGTSLADIENNRNWEELAIRSSVNAKAALMSGFTTWRDAGGMGAGLRKTIDAGLVVGAAGSTGRIGPIDKGRIRPQLSRALIRCLRTPRRLRRAVLFPHRRRSVRPLP